MKALRVNVDYESVLFYGKESLLQNQALEYLLLYLEERPLFTHKKYSSDFLNHVKAVTGRGPKITQEGPWENWWGALQNIPLEKKLNSKEFSASLSEESQIITSIDEIQLEPGKTYLAKDPYGMSGMGFVIFNSLTPELQNLLSKCKKIIVEPLFARERDFSHYVLPDKTICYENLVDQKFQYKGTLFSDLHHPDISHLRFYSEIPLEEWNQFELNLKTILHAYSEAGVHSGFSLDSFTYQKDNKHQIRALSEINYRKTMGLIAWKLSERFAGKNSWALFILAKSKMNFQAIKKALEPIAYQSETSSGCLQLSPGDARFEMFLLIASSEKEGRELFKKTKELLPDCQFAIEL